jgi:hypothetical protein
MARPDNFDELVEVLNASGWLVTDCFQPNVDTWSIALRKDGDFSRAYGNGSTPSEALQKAMENRRGRTVDARKDKRPIIKAPGYYEFDLPKRKRKAKRVRLK